MHLGTYISIVVGIRLYQPIQFIHHLTITHNYHPDTTHAGTVLIGGFEIYCSETFHLSMILYHFIQSFFIQDFLRNKASPMSKTLSNIFRSKRSHLFQSYETTIFLNLSKSIRKTYMCQDIL